MFDYIVIGAGTAGGVIAKKLTDDKKTSVLVLEAGTDMTAELTSGSIEEAIFLASDNRYAYNLTSTIEAMIGRPLLSQKCRTLGGSSEINDMYSVRGSRELYNRWAELVGDQWSYDQIRSLFKENETYTGDTQNPAERGTNGPIFIRQQIIPTSGLIQTLTNETAQVLGIPVVQDYNTGIRDCTFYQGQYNQREVNGEFVRSSTATGYLNAQIVTPGNQFQSDQFGVNRRRLAIFGKTTVDKIVFQKKKKRGKYVAVGVDFVKNGVSMRSYARKGIIVSAGFFSSVILQRSGIGKTEDLTRAGIQTLIESPNMGYNMQAHAYVGMGVRVETSQLVPILLADPDQPLALGAFKAEHPASLEAYVKGSYSNFFHFGGQCRMAETIEEGVVDGFLNVFGTKNLKVADLSVSPILPDGNTGIAAEMIGLNAARFMKKDPNSCILSDDELEEDDDEED
ncbi:GMC family oxidoreductase [Brevibacillus centrosporus]|uniref:GMC family oxidoreductase n=1 Tax=Brevibacillus centrosporus TaxID=54910 RepID=UPI000F09FEB0|nr:GMC family oxidoreductase [Brevibacillus centrosporus]MEC2127517.1 GMC family oxidoreductase [Brevibacillus centrosporus]RNB67856.1 GMC family oxidoreductase [Brevibacillus centrosporus]